MMSARESEFNSKIILDYSRKHVTLVSRLSGLSVVLRLYTLRPPVVFFLVAWCAVSPSPQRCLKEDVE